MYTLLCWSKTAKSEEESGTMQVTHIERWELADSVMRSRDWIEARPSFNSYVMMPPTAMSPTTIEVGSDSAADEMRVSAAGGLGSVTIDWIKVPETFWSRSSSVYYCPF